ncbi:MAG TPA: preprotein translocase subunit YajC [Pirellulales bacterium]|nr:preprotein translocase subunit YajC [Pirellulales bacterium]
MPTAVYSCVNFVLLLAADEKAPAAGGGAAGSQGGSIVQMMFPLILIFVLFYFLMMRPEKRKQADHKALLEALKKNDRVVTIGGIYGVVANVQRDADRVTIKVDETTNTKLDVTFGAIARVVVEQSETEAK